MGVTTLCPAPGAAETAAAEAIATAIASQPEVLQPTGPQAGFGDLLVLGAGGQFRLADAAMASHVPFLDGEQVTIAALAGPWLPGRHAVALQTVPAAGETPVRQPPLQFVYDPGAPTIQWEVGTTAMLDAHGLDQDVDRDRPPHRVSPEPDARVKILWSPDGRRWLPLLPRDARANRTGALAEWLTAADRPQIFLWALGEQVFAAGAPVSPKKLELVRVWAGDELSAVRDLRLRVLPVVAGGYQLEMVATDLVGNATTVTWPLLLR
jgi:hypothetical protein